MKPPPAIVTIGEASTGNWIAAGVVDAQGNWALSAISSAAGYPVASIGDANAALLSTVSIASLGTTSARVAVGTTDGLVQFESASTLPTPASTTLWSAQPQLFSGFIQLQYATPPNGFLGTTLLVAQVAWKHPVPGSASVTETASFFDWLDVTGPLGEYPDDPAYPADLATWQREWAGPP
ncbi:MAG: hypothetical protein ACYDCK_02830 [Thermoplasmatota archaeon]